MSEYYMAYENRYKKVFEAGGTVWGHSPEDKELVEAISKWVDGNGLKNGQIIEFACGEGASGVILSRLGCTYHGVDISPTAVEKAKDALRDYSGANVSLLNMVEQRVDGLYDAAIDVMGFHMLVVDSDRRKYLKNAFDSLKSGAPMLFYRQAYRTDAYDGTVESFEEWKSISGSDYDTPEQRFAKGVNGDVEVYIPLVPARAKNRDGFIKEFMDVGFVVEHFEENPSNEQIITSVNIYVRKS